MEPEAGALIAAIERDGASLEERVAAAEKLGELGDPRPEMSVAVPAGRFVMGTDPEEEPDQRPHESPQLRPDLSEYTVMRTVVTVAQFRRFVDGGGYETPALWSAEGWAWKTEARVSCPRFWSPEEHAEWAPYLTPNRPVVGVSWFEAEAYAQFVDARLPTEAEWEKAARGTDGRSYPWGDEWRDDQAAWREWGPRKTLPVGVFPRGESPWGALDMVGCVWQWCADWYAADAYAHAGLRDPIGPADPTEPPRRVVRGGAWNTLRFSLRCANRNSYPEAARFSNLGFRCVRSV